MEQTRRLMGAGIIQVLAQNGYEVVLRARRQTSVDKGIATVTKNLEKMVKKEKNTEADKDEILSRVSGSTDISIIKDADLIIEAADAEGIDTAMQLGANYLMGPLALGDLIGLDVCLAIMEPLYREFGDTKYRPHPLLRKMVRDNKLGRKTGVGFYKYEKVER